MVSLKSLSTPGEAGGIHLDPMKLRLCLLLCLCSVTPAFASKLVDNLKAGKDQTVVVYGTSLTAGGKWVASTKEWLGSINPDAKVNIINGGQSGQNSLVGLAKLDDVVIAKKPDTVFIEFAVNDAFLYPEEKKRVSAEESGRNLETMIVRIREALPEAEIIVQTMNPAWDSPKGNGSASKRPDLAACYESYRKVAAKHGLLLIDHHKNWEKIRAESEDLFRTYVMDGIHPTADASVKVTFPEVKKMLEQ
ncbi:MAG: SGNH/GDSL hydrolase family protein [Verrucomicrobiaceae bacterium]|nr:MAG: SGNH/GDSL hydrolase family protein [Verrucomicrobiaceae bacterium]